jgi:hypothetical protein
MKTIALVAGLLLACYVGLSEQVAVDGDCASAACDAGLYCETQTDSSKKCKIQVGGACVDTETKCVAGANPCTASAVCTCGSGKVASSDNNMCLTNPGGVCTANAECITNAQCGQAGTGACHCKPGYSVNAAFTQCSAAAGIFASVLTLLGALVAARSL